MSRKVSREPTYPEVAEALEKWATKRGIPDDAYIQRLGESLKTGKDLSFWAEHTPMEWLPRPQSLASKNLAYISRLIAIVRNVLIFAPVALTWFAIGEATRAFDQYVDAGADSTANFLEFWQDGKGLLDEKWRIGNVATLDFQIILVLILLSLVAGVLQVRALSISQKDNEIFEKERIALALRIDDVLELHRSGTEQGIATRISAILEKLDNVTKNVESASRHMAKSAKQLSPSVSKSMTEVKSTITRVNKSTKDLQKIGRLLLRARDSLIRSDSSKKKTK